MNEKPAHRPRGTSLVRMQQRHQEIASMLDSGMSQMDIAVHFGVTQSAVSQMIKKALKNYPGRTVHMERELMLLQLEEAADRVTEVMNASHPYVSEGRVVFPVVGHDASGKPIYGDEPLQDAGPVLKAATTLVTVLKRRAEQIGADAPKRIESTNLNVKAADLPVMKLINSLEQANQDSRKEITRRVQAQRVLPSGQWAAVPHGAGEHRRRYGRVAERLWE